MKKKSNLRNFIIKFKDSEVNPIMKCLPRVGAAGGVAGACEGRGSRVMGTEPRLPRLPEPAWAKHPIADDRNKALKTHNKTTSLNHF